MTPAERFKDHFSDVAAAYAAHRPSYPPGLGDFLAQLAPARRLAWDAGCGSGQLSLLLAGVFERVVATDASPEQIAQAARHPNVEYRCGRAEASGLPERGADVATAAQAAHWFDLPAYYAEVRRVVRPGGVVALISYGVVTAGPDLDAVIQPFYREVLARYWPPERRHVDAGYPKIWSVTWGPGPPYGRSSGRQDRAPSRRSAASSRLGGGHRRRCGPCAGRSRFGWGGCEGRADHSLARVPRARSG